MFMCRASHSSINLDALQGEGEFKNPLEGKFCQYLVNISKHVGVRIFDLLLPSAAAACMKNFTHMHKIEELMSSILMVKATN